MPPRGLPQGEGNSGLSYPYWDARKESESLCLPLEKGKTARPIYTTVPTITFEDPKIFDKVKKMVEKELREDS